MVALLWQALRWRRSTSLAVLAAALAATAAAALGPMYARSAEESLVLQRFRQADAVTVGLTVGAPLAGAGEFEGDPSAATADPPDVADAARAVATDRRFDRWFGAATTSVTTPPVAFAVGDAAPDAQASLSWRDRACEALVLEAGTCTPGPDGALVSRRTADRYGLALGATVRVALGDEAGEKSLRVVGVWTAPKDLERLWGAESPLQFAEPRKLDDVLRVDQVLVDRSTLAVRTLRGSATVYRPLRRDRLTLATATDAVADVAAVDREVKAADGGRRPAGAGTTPPLRVTNGIATVLDGVQPERSDLRAAALTVAAQLLLLGWYVLFLVVSATAEQRGAEVALAKLRGLSPARTAALALSEVAALVLLAAPLGLAVAWGVATAMTRGVLLDGVGVSLRAPVVGALAVAVVGGLVAAGLATRALLRAPVLDQLRRTGGSRGALFRSVAVDAVALVLAAQGVYLLRSGVAAPLALLTPTLLALAVGLLGVRLLPLVARLAVRRTRGRPSVAGFLAARNLARRTAGARPAVLLAVAVAVVVFGVQEWRIATLVRADLARSQVPADRVVHVDGPGPPGLLAAVRAADPEGRWAMAADLSGGTLAVDVPRLAAVSAWDPAWTGTDADRLAAALRPPGEPPIVLTGRVAVTLVNELEPATVQGTVSVVVAQPAGGDQLVTLGPLRPGTRAYAADLPACATGCRLLRVVPAVDAFADPAPSGGVVVTQVADARGPVDAGLRRDGAWRATRTVTTLLDPSATQGTVAPDDRGLALAVQDGTLPVAQHAEHPLDVPAVVGSTSSYSPADDLGRTVYVPGFDGQQVIAEPVGARGVLPLVGRTGALVDLDTIVASSVFRTWGTDDEQVWLSAAAPPDALDRLRAAGLAVVSTDSLAERRADLDRDGTSLALLLDLAAAAAALVVSGGALLAWTLLGARRRAYELAAARMLGARHGALVAAGRREQLTLVLLGTVLGTASGLVATVLVLRALPAVSGGDAAPRTHGVQWPLAGAVVLGTLLVLAACVELAVRRVAAGADTRLLRSVQA